MSRGTEQADCCTQSFASHLAVAIGSAKVAIAYLKPSIWTLSYLNFRFLSSDGIGDHTCACWVVF